MLDDFQRTSGYRRKNTSGFRGYLLLNDSMWQTRPSILFQVLKQNYERYKREII